MFIIIIIAFFLKKSFFFFQTVLKFHQNLHHIIGDGTFDMGERILDQRFICKISSGERILSISDFNNHFFLDFCICTVCICNVCRCMTIWIQRGGRIHWKKKTSFFFGNFDPKNFFIFTKKKKKNLSLKLTKHKIIMCR